jgi:hypothetical protein
MGSVPVQRHKQAAQACLLFQRLPAEAQKEDWSAEDLEHRTKEILKKLEELCAPEILKAVLEHYNEAGLSGLYAGTVQRPPYTILYVLREDVEVIYTGLRRAANSVSGSSAPFLEHVEDCVAESVLEQSAELLRNLALFKPRDLLELCAAASLDRSRFIIEHLSEEQRLALSRSLRRELGDKPIPLRMDQEPKLPANPTRKQRYAWWHWYILWLKMHENAQREALGGVPRVVVAMDEERLAKKRKTGEIIDPLGPIWVKHWSALARELNKTGHPIKDPESKNRFAKSLGISRSTVKRYLDEDIPMKITPDGKGRICTEWDMSALLKALDVSSRKKRKPPG